MTQAIRQALSWLLLAGLGWCLFQVIRPFLDALAWAAVLAVFFSPAHRRIHQRLRKPNWAALLSTTLVTLILILPTVMVGQALIHEAVGMFSNSQTLLPRLWAFLGSLESRIPSFLPVDTLEKVLAEASAWGKSNLAHLSASLAGNLAQVFFELSVVIFALFYFFRDGYAFVHRLARLSLLGQDLRDRLVGEVAETVQVTVTALLLVSATQGFLGGLIFAILGLASPVLWGVVMGLASVVPMFGAALVWAPQGLWLIINGETAKGIGLLIYGAVVISSSDNILRPLLITGRSQVNALLVFIAVVGGIQAFGLVGAVLGPVLLGTASGLLRAFDEHHEQAQPEPPIGTEGGAASLLAPQGESLSEE